MRQLAIAALLCTLASLSFGEDLRKAAADNARGFDNAMKTKDIGWFKKTAAPDFYEESRGKKVPRDTAIQNIQTLFGFGKITTCSTKVLKVTKQGNSMVVRASAHLVMMMTPGPNSKKASKMVGDTMYDEKWTKDHGHWKVNWIKTLKDSGSIDGKPMPPDM